MIVVSRHVPVFILIKANKLTDEEKKELEELRSTIASFTSLKTKANRYKDYDVVKVRLSPSKLTPLVAINIRTLPLLSPALKEKIIDELLLGGSKNEAVDGK